MASPVPVWWSEEPGTADTARPSERLRDHVPGGSPDDSGLGLRRAVSHRPRDSLKHRDSYTARQQGVGSPDATNRMDLPSSGPRMLEGDRRASRPEPETDRADGPRLPQGGGGPFAAPTSVPARRHARVRFGASARSWPPAAARRSGVSHERKPCSIPHSSACVRPPASILRYRVRT